uniref:Protein sleepless n=1 Tax=Trichuris muris TaxID=70415 RepID=A0A5S6QZU5_TRIMR
MEYPIGSPGRQLLISLLAVAALFRAALCLTCYLCSSVNHSDPYCEDTFNTDYVGINYLQHECMAPRKDRRGYFPADHCIKVSGVSTVNSNYTVVVRTCAMDSGSLTADTEIVRMSHCGHFILDDHYFSGCVQTCDTDGCNTGTRRTVAQLTVAFLLVLLLSQATLLRSSAS